MNCMYCIKNLNVILWLDTIKFSFTLCDITSWCDPGIYEEVPRLEVAFLNWVRAAYVHMMDAAANSAIAQLICISICTWLCICVYDFSVFVICRSLCLYFHLWWPWYIFEQVWRWRLAKWWPCRVEDLLWCLLEPLFMGKGCICICFCICIQQ